MAESTEEQKCIGVYTSGDDSPGMNPALVGIVRAAIKRGVQVYGIEDGYAGMCAGGDYFKKMDWDSVNGIIEKGGTILGCSKSKKFERKEQKDAVFNLVTRGITYLICIGDDEAMSCANTLRSKWKECLSELVEEKKITQEVADKYPQLKLVGLPAAIDNECYGTECLGSDTALHRICSMIDYITTTATSHKRAFVIEVMGEYCGHLALAASICTAADWVFVPELPAPPGWEEKMIEAIKFGRSTEMKRCTLVIVAEGSKNTAGKKISSEYVKDVLVSLLKVDSRVSILGYTQRGGPPSPYDRYFGVSAGIECVNTLLDSNNDEPALIGMHGYTVVRKKLVDCVDQTCKMNRCLEERKFDEARNMRGPDFEELLHTFFVCKKPHKHKIPDPKFGNIKFAILNVGASVPGMNAAVRILVRMALNYGHTPYGVHKGWEGFMADDIKEMDWFSVSGWAPFGGTFLGTSRALPDPKIVAEIIEKRGFRSLIIVGGFEGLTSIWMLMEAREKYPALNIPMFLIPATVSNNIPGTHATIGMDGAANNIMKATDKLVASNIRYSKRVFVVDISGQKCGYLTLMSGIISEAQQIYLPEEGIDLKLLQKHLELLSSKFMNAKYDTVLFMRNEHASPLFTATFIEKMFQMENPNLSVRKSIMGHTQQGGNPTPLDRLHATRMAAAAIKFLDENADKTDCYVIGIIDSLIKFTDVSTLKDKVDMENRRPKEQWWLPLKEKVFDIISNDWE